jgi:rhodanese-related sulfurtransferase
MPTTSTSITADELMALIGTPQAPLTFDVRKAAAFAEADCTIAGARWRDHASAAEWGQCLNPLADVVVYCVHGHEVSQGAAASLRLIGMNARYLEGGIEGFMAGGGSTQPRLELPQAGTGSAIDQGKGIR